MRDLFAPSLFALTLVAATGVADVASAQQVGEPAALAEEAPQPAETAGTQVALQTTEPAQAPKKGPTLIVGLAVGPGNMGPSVGLQIGENSTAHLTLLPIIAPDFVFFHAGVRLTQDIRKQDKRNLYLVEALGLTTGTENINLASVGVGIGVRTDSYKAMGDASLWLEARLTGFFEDGDPTLLVPVPAAGVTWSF